MKQAILFIMTFIFVFVIYRFILLGKKKKKAKKPMEVSYLINKYKLDLKKVKYDSLLTTVALVSSIDISVVVTLVLLIDNYLLQIVGALVLVIPIILISYSFVGKYYIKKGMIKDE